MVSEAATNCQQLKLADDAARTNAIIARTTRIAGCGAQLVFHYRLWIISFDCRSRRRATAQGVFQGPQMGLFEF